MTFSDMENFVISKKQYDELMEIDRANAVNLFFFLLSRADENGELTVSVRTISAELNIGIWVVRGLLKKLYATQKLTHQTTHRNSGICICNIDSYNGKLFCDHTPNHTVNHTVKKTIEERKNEFADKLKPYLEKYGKDMLNNFYQYWTQVNDGGVKMLFEMQKAFQVPNRLATWRRNNYGSQGGMGTGVVLKDSASKDYKKGGW